MHFVIFHSLSANAYAAQNTEVIDIYCISFTSIGSWPALFRYGFGVHFSHHVAMMFTPRHKGYCILSLIADWVSFYATSYELCLASPPPELRQNDSQLSRLKDIFLPRIITRVMNILPILRWEIYMKFVLSMYIDTPRYWRALPREDYRVPKRPNIAFIDVTRYLYYWITFHHSASNKVSALIFDISYWNWHTRLSYY